jgi:PAS domain S-box-containing protein
MATIRSHVVRPLASSLRRAEPEIPRLRDLLGRAPAAIGYLGGPDLRWGYVNDLLVIAAGRVSADDLIGFTFRESMPELAGTGIADLLEGVYRTGIPYRGKEYKVRFHQFETGRLEDRYFDYVAQPVFSGSRHITGILVHAVDITAQVVTRLEVQANEERLRLAQEAARIGTWEWNPVQNTRTLSDQLHWMFGTSPSMTEEQIHRLWASRVYPEDWPKVQSGLKEAERTGIQDSEYRYQHPQNGLRCFCSKGGRMKGASSYFGVVIDVTERKHSEELQQEKERGIEESRERLQAAFSVSQRLAAIVESSDDAIIGKDLDGVVTCWNPGAEKMFGYTGEEMIGQSIRKIIPPEVIEDEDRIMSAVARGERTQHFETLRRRKSGEVMEVSFTVSPVRDECGKIVGVASISRDITQSRKVERALNVSERLASVGRLAATIAHEINNPLEAVTNLIFLAQNCPMDEDKQRFLEQAQHELARVALLTKQTLGFYRENKGASSVTMGELVSPLVSVFSARARNKAIRIETEIRQNPTIHAIAGEIRQLFANLLNNSIDAVKDGGRILIRVSAAKERSGAQRAGVRLSVADTGSGIPHDLRKKLYEPFFTTKKDVGTGLGLWVTNSILEKHKGSIRVRSCVDPGRSWTVFSVFLPADGVHGIQP